MFIAANWKMYLDKSGVEEFSNIIKTYNFNEKIKTCIFPSNVYISCLKKLIKNMPISVGAQNCHYETKGAFTGEVSSNFLKDVGCDYVILGHSERRNANKESNLHVQKCASSAINSNLIPIICVGESFKDRKNGTALDFITKQVIESLPKSFENIIIAYEPVWSIGTGKIPSKIEIKEMHEHIKDLIFLKYNKSIKVLYGGSVNSSNICDILLVDNVDGFLIGGASLNAKDFLAIYSSTVKHLDKFSF
ncbi:triose-phosphate isomerase [Alphaproteobacteria bacterium]|nr:triose-phosphate isomerase [Alphaproteobacteria bacterium]